MGNKQAHWGGGQVPSSSSFPKSQAFKRQLCKGHVGPLSIAGGVHFSAECGGQRYRRVLSSCGLIAKTVRPSVIPHDRGRWGNQQVLPGPSLGPWFRQLPDLRAGLLPESHAQHHTWEMRCRLVECRGFVGSQVGVPSPNPPLGGPWQSLGRSQPQFLI